MSKGAHAQDNVAVEEERFNAVVEEKVPTILEESADLEDAAYFGDLLPFCDPAWYQGNASPYYRESHIRVRGWMRKFVDEHVIPNVYDWDVERQVPKEFYQLAGREGLLTAVTGPSWPTYAKDIKVPGGIPPDEWDAFHSLIVIDELSRCGSGGFVWSVCGGHAIGLPPIMKFASEEMQDRIVAPCLKGDKRICLAVTEPSGGSDVANITTTAVKSDDGKHYIVNGEKKWIGGIYSDYFTVAVRTGGNGMGGISLLLIERDFPGIKTTKMDCMGVLASGTTYVTFEDVKVPVSNLIGRENKGFQLIMSNFNPERMGIAMQANRFARVCLEECIKYGSKRKTFGVLLRDHPVIRAKLANMAHRVEATHAWIESLVHQTASYEAEELTLRLGGPIALVKAQAAKNFEYCAGEAMQIFGGAGYTKGGVGEVIERLYREVRAYTLPGGSEEIMLDLGVRQSIKISQIMGAKL